MSVYKIPLDKNVLQAAQERITWTLETLPRVCVSFSGGKDSGLMLHLTAAIARQLQKNKRLIYRLGGSVFLHDRLCPGATRELFRCHRRILLGCIAADDAKFTVTISA